MQESFFLIPFRDFDKIDAKAHPSQGVDVTIAIFGRFSPIFGGKGVFMKSQCYDPNFAQTSSIFSKKGHFLRRKYFKNFQSSKKFQGSML
jgi:hypothetical protein